MLFGVDPETLRNEIHRDTVNVLYQPLNGREQLLSNVPVNINLNLALALKQLVRVVSFR